MKKSNFGGCGRSVKSKQSGVSLLVILGILAALALLAGVAAAIMKPGQSGDTSPAKAKADAVQLIESVGSARSAAGNLVGVAGSYGSGWQVFGTTTSNGANIFSLGDAASGASPISAAVDNDANKNNSVSLLPHGATGSLTMAYTVPLANGAVFGYTQPDVPAATCDQFNLAVRGSIAQAVDATLGAAPTTTSTTTVIANAAPAGFTTAAAAGDGCYRAAADSTTGAIVVKIM